MISLKSHEERYEGEGNIWPIWAMPISFGFSFFSGKQNTDPTKRNAHCTCYVAKPRNYFESTLHCSCCCNVLFIGRVLQNVLYSSRCFLNTILYLIGQICICPRKSGSFLVFSSAGWTIPTVVVGSQQNSCKGQA